MPPLSVAEALAIAIQIARALDVRTVIASCTAISSRAT